MPVRKTPAAVGTLNRFICQEATLTLCFLLGILQPKRSPAGWMTVKMALQIWPLRRLSSAQSIFLEPFVFAYPLINGGTICACLAFSWRFGICGAAQMLRALPSHGRGPVFESLRLHHLVHNPVASPFLNQPLKIRGVFC